MNEWRMKIAWHDAGKGGRGSQATFMLPYCSTWQSRGAWRSFETVREERLQKVFFARFQPPRLLLRRTQDCRPAIRPQIRKADRARKMRELRRLKKIRQKKEGDDEVFRRGKAGLPLQVHVQDKPYQRSTKQKDRDTALKLEAAELFAPDARRCRLEAPVSAISKRQYRTIDSLIDALEADYKLRNILSSQTASHFKRVRADLVNSVRATLLARMWNVHSEAPCE